MEADLFSQNQEENLELQEMYFHMLDKILDAVVLFKYDQDRENREYVSVNQLHDRVLTCFSKIHSFNKISELKTLAQKISIVTGRYDEKNYYFEMLESFYQFYTTDPLSLSSTVTSSFYNEILNKQQDAFCRSEKGKLIEKLKKILPLTAKKQETILKTARIEKMNQWFREGKPYLLGLQSFEACEIKRKVHEKIQNSKYLKKKLIFLSDEEFERLDDLFFTGCLTDQAINESFERELPLSFLTFIKNQYYRVILPYLERIEEEHLVLSRKCVSYDYNQLLIFSYERYQKNYQQLCSYMNEEKIDPSILEKEENQIFLSLLPLVNLVDIFDTKMLASILKNSEVIFERMEEKGIPTTQEAFLNQFHQVMKFATIYNQVTPRVISILKEAVVEKILNGNCFVSRNPMDYVSVYQKMLQRSLTHIPPISFSYGDYMVESGVMADPSRLLLSQNCQYSCLAPGGAGSVAYHESLTGEDADVLLIKDKSGNFVARSLLFRRGNYIVMSAIIGESSLQRQFYCTPFLTTVAEEIKKQATKCGDHLDYLFLTNAYGQIKLEEYPLIQNKELVRQLPYADWAEENYLISGPDHEFRPHQDSRVQSYFQIREPVVRMRQDYQEDICKIRALNFFYTGATPEFSKEEYNFSTFSEVYKGQDWYLALWDDGSYDFVALPTGDVRQSAEIDGTFKEIENKGYVKIKK